MKPFATAHAKSALRSLAKQRRAALPADMRATHSATIQRRIIDHGAFQAAHCVLAYSSFGDEVDTGALLAAVHAQGKILLLPRIEHTSGRLVLHAVADTERDLRTGQWGIREPDPQRCPVADIAAADLIAVPGVAFAADGGRIGYGKGYYDRLLPGARHGADAPMTVALAFEAQIFGDLPCEAHDLPMRWIASEQRLIDCRRAD